MNYCIIAGIACCPATVANMPKQKLRKFRAVQAVKAAAREQIGSPPATRRQPQRKKPAEQKHKPTLGDMLAED